MAVCSVGWRCLLLLTVLGLVSCQGNDNDADFPSLLAILGSKLSAADDTDPSSSEETSLINDAEPEAPCCFPKVWQGRIVSEFGFSSGRRPSLAGSIDQVFVDGNKKRLAGNKLECHGGKPAKYSYIMLTGANKTGDLYLFAKTAKKCRHIKLPNAVWKPQCLPANSTLRGTHSLGPAKGGLTVQSWTFHVGSKRSALEFTDRPRPRPKMSVSANVLVVPKSCVPVMIQENGFIRRGGKGQEEENDDDSSDSKDSSEDTNDTKPKPRPRGTAFVGGMYFSDLQTRIVDPSVFTPPAYCKKADNSLFDDDEDDMEDIIPSVLKNYLLL